MLRHLKDVFFLPEKTPEEFPEKTAGGDSGSWLWIPILTIPNTPEKLSWGRPVDASRLWFRQTMAGPSCRLSRHGGVELRAEAHPERAGP